MRIANLLRPRYVFDRINLWRVQRSHPDYPWLTRQAISILETCLKPSDTGLEWGSGRSTVRFARRISKLVSIENDPAWYSRVQGMVSMLPNVDLRLLPEQAAYVGVTDEFPDRSFDFILVDGMLARDECAHRALRLLRPGGLLVLDNANWYLACTSRAPLSRGGCRVGRTPIPGTFLRRRWLLGGAYGQAMDSPTPRCGLRGPAWTTATTGA